MSSNTILLAAADSSQRQLVDLLLSQDGHRLVAVETAREALAYLRENTPDLAILALDLPDLGGDVVCQKLKAVTRLSKTPAILIAPHAERGTEGQLRLLARRAGADVLLPLPLGDKDLRGRVRRLLSSTAPDVNEAARHAEDSQRPTHVSR